MFIEKLSLQNFRCFKNNSFKFEKPIILIEGKNGSGKTTLLEALHYCCFLKSFRSGGTKKIVSHDDKHMFSHVSFKNLETNSLNQIQVGTSFENGPQKKLVKLNERPIKSHKEIIKDYRVISLTEDDLDLVQGSPEIRRIFLNQLLVLIDPEFITQFRKYKQILENRNKVISSFLSLTQDFKDELKIWTEQLWNQSRIIQKKRVGHLKELQQEVNDLIKNYFDSQFIVKFEYKIKNGANKRNLTDFWNFYQEKLIEEEINKRYSVFGPHSDDFSITFHKANARYFASRGQQKIISFLLKIALQKMMQRVGQNPPLLLDDFFTDFDSDRLSKCLCLLNDLSCQVFLTCPIANFLNGFMDFGEGRVQTLRL